VNERVCHPRPPIASRFGRSPIGPSQTPPIRIRRVAFPGWRFRQAGRRRFRLFLQGNERTAPGLRDDPGLHRTPRTGDLTPRVSRIPPIGDLTSDDRKTSLRLARTVCCDPTYGSTRLGPRAEEGIRGAPHPLPRREARTARLRDRRVPAARSGSTSPRCIPSSTGSRRRACWRDAGSRRRRSGAAATTA
jgi:hypothetical protein